MSGHGHVTPNANGMKARCGGPAICPECAKEAFSVGRKTTPDYGALLLAHLRIAGHPIPEAEVRFHPTRKWRFDFAYPLRLIAIEIEGGIYAGGRHTRGSGFAEDVRKYNSATLNGWHLIRLTGEMVETGEAVEVIADALTVFA